MKPLKSIIRFGIIAVLIALLTTITLAQRLPLPPNPNPALAPRAGEPSLYYLDPPLSGSQAISSFGSAIAMNPGLIAIGAPLEDVGGFTEAGAVYIYRPDGAGGWIEAQRISAPVPTDGAKFGSAVDIHGSGDGAWILVGSPNALVDPSPTPGDELANAGKIYLFKPSITPGLWDFSGSMTSQFPNENGFFGTVVDIWDNGTSQPSMLIGAPGETPFSTRTGAVYLYQFNAGSPVVPPERFTPSDQQTDMMFGAAIARGDSSATPRFFVGAPQFDSPTSNAGQIYSFTFISSYFEDAKLGSPSPHLNGNFGAAIAGYYNGADVYTMAVGAPGEGMNPLIQSGRVYVYTDDLGTGTGFGAPEILTAGADNAARRKFGSSLMMRDVEGMRRLIVGAPTDDATNTGRAYLFDEEDTADWQIEETLTGNDNRTDMFGYDVHIEEQDGLTVVLVGAPLGRPDAGIDETPGAAFFFTRPTPGVTVDTSFAEPYTSFEDGSQDFEYTFFLNTQPTADVLVDVEYIGDDCVIADPVRDDSDSIIFDALNWNMPFSVKIQAVNDDIAEIAETCTITHTITTTDPDYASVTIPDMVVNVESDDMAGVNKVYQGGTNFTLSEDGTQVDNLFLSLTSEPTGIVVINLTFTGDDCTVAGPIRDSTVSLTFTAANWDTNQIVALAALDDTEIESFETCTLDFDIDRDFTLDPIYDDVTIASDTFAVIDDDGVPTSTELVRNGSMEDPVVAKPFKPINWTFRKLSSKDRRICPGSGSPKVHSGDCSVQMNGTVDAPRSVLRATRTKTDLTDNLGLSLTVGDTLRVQFKYKLHRKTDALVRLVAFRNFGGDRTVLARVELPHPLDEDYTQWLTFDQTFTLTTTDFKQLRLIFRDLSKGGNWWIDDVSLLYTPDSGGGARFRAP